MQVFISDVHLTDGTSGETIKAGAFKLFGDQLKKLVQDVNAKELKIVLLGDIFDVIRSTKWLDVTVRPWSVRGSAQEAVVQCIVTDILAKNQKSLKCFDDLRQFAGKMKIPFELQYVIGNHDWLINRYDSLRKDVAAALGMIQPNDPTPDKFPTEIPEPAYKTFARHGDIYDKFNYMGNRDKSSIGDVVVIELLNRFPIAVELALDVLVYNKIITAKESRDIVDKLKEIDNVRPQSEIFSWFLMVSNRIKDASIRQAIENAWHLCVDYFSRASLIRERWIWARFSIKKEFHLFSRTYKILNRIFEKLNKLKKRFFPTLGETDYNKKALAESSNEARYVLYGHTHDHQIVPMDQVPLNSVDTEDKIYFNTGTWRQTWNKVVFDKANIEFIDWKVLTYVVFYKADENKNYNFEVWNGALG